MRGLQTDDAIAPRVDPIGQRGFVVVTAYATDARCRDASALGCGPAD